MIENFVEVKKFYRIKVLWNFDRKKFCNTLIIQITRSESEVVTTLKLPKNISGTFGFICIRYTG